MKLSSKMERCGFSPMRKFNPLADEVKARGIKIYHLNIGQPDVETPAPFFQALRDYHDKVVSYAPSSGVPAFVDAIRGYYRRIGVSLERGDILPTFGGRWGRDHHSGALLPELRHLRHPRGGQHPPHPHKGGGGLLLR